MHDRHLSLSLRLFSRRFWSFFRYVRGLRCKGVSHGVEVERVCQICVRQQLPVHTYIYMIYIHTSKTIQVYLFCRHASSRYAIIPLLRTPRIVNAYRTGIIIFAPSGMAENQRELACVLSSLCLDTELPKSVLDVNIVYKPSFVL